MTAPTSVRDHYRELRAAGDVLLTSNLVVSETATRLRFDAGLDVALAFRELLDAAVAAGRLIVRHTDPEVDAKAWALMERHPDARSRSPTASAPSPPPRGARRRLRPRPRLPRARVRRATASATRRRDLARARVAGGSSPLSGPAGKELHPE